MNVENGARKADEVHNGSARMEQEGPEIQAGSVGTIHQSEGRHAEVPKLTRVDDALAQHLERDRSVTQLNRTGTNRDEVEKSSAAKKHEMAADMSGIFRHGALDEKTTLQPGVPGETNQMQTVIIRSEGYSAKKTPHP